jgi:formylglycine-generating enzyme required for sulfatase activity
MKIKVLAVIVCMMAAVNFASADTIRGIGMDFVTIGNPGNAADTGGTPGCGAVGYNYRIGKYEVTNAQWNTFTAAAGAPTGNPTDAYNESAYWTGAQQPTNNVSWYETLQFCNYLTSGDKSKGVYQFSGDNANPDTFLGIDRDAAKAVYGTIYVLPTEDEWYKAAYFSPNGSNYWPYATGTIIAPGPGIDSNFKYWVGAPWNVGTGTQEQNGTFDMMGNVWEWNETLFDGSYRDLRGGSYYYNHDALLSSSHDDYHYSLNGLYDVGFRVAEVPEPATLLLLGLGGFVLRRKK